MIGALAFSIGVLLLVVWAVKHLSAHSLWKWGWIWTGAGAVVCLLSLGVFSFHELRSHGFNRGFTMMKTISNGTDTDAQKKEEEEGKALYEKLMAKQLTCKDVAESDFELIGEYVMGARAGDSHEQMNIMMKRAMGEWGEEQMHITLGRIATNCQDSKSLSSLGMMQGGMMMQAVSSKAR